MGDKNAELYTLILSVIVFFFILTCFIIYFVILYKNKQLKNEQEQEQLKATFNQELLKSQLEIQEQTLQNVSEDIHDNIGQVLSFVKLNLATTKGLEDEQKDERIAENRELLAQAISDLRDLSKSLSKQNISSRGFVQTIQIEIDRIIKSGLIQIEFSIKGDIINLGDKRELVLFRILQESINNVLKHSGANHLKISLHYSADLFTLTLSDDGSGFDTQFAEGKNGAGIKNIRNRAILIGAEVKINSAVGKGSEVILHLNPIDSQTYAHGNYPGSHS